MHIVCQYGSASCRSLKSQIFLRESVVGPKALENEVDPRETVYFVYGYSIHYPQCFYHMERLMMGQRSTAQCHNDGPTKHHKRANFSSFIQRYSIRLGCRWYNSISRSFRRLSSTTICYNSCCVFMVSNEINSMGYPGINIHFSDFNFLMRLIRTSSLGAHLLIWLKMGPK